MHIYKFTHKESGRSYVGQTIQDPNRRRLEHVCHSKHSPKSYHFHNALNLYGVDSFTFEVVAQATSLEELNSLETKFIDQCNSITTGFNIREGGGNKLHSEESKVRMQIAQRAAHARRRENNNGIEMHSAPRSHKGKTGLWTYTTEQKAEHSKKMKEISKVVSKGKTWKVIDGKRVWITKEASV